MSNDYEAGFAAGINRARYIVKSAMGCDAKESTVKAFKYLDALLEDNCTFDQHMDKIAAHQSTKQ